MYLKLYVYIYGGHLGIHFFLKEKTMKETKVQTPKVSPFFELWMCLGGIGVIICKVPNK